MNLIKKIHKYFICNNRFYKNRLVLKMKILKIIQFVAKILKAIKIKLKRISKKLWNSKQNKNNQKL